MASATGLPARPPTDSDTALTSESEPLLGRPGDVLQKPDESVLHNLYNGTGWVAQAGAFLLLALVWSSVFLNKLLPLFSPHPLLQSLGVFTLVQAILILQPTWTAAEKTIGARAHASLNLLSFLLFGAGIAIIETNKIKNNGAHFHSVHGYLGVITGVVLLGQYVFGFLMWGVPGVFGGVNNAKALWKYHRISGYALFLLLLATVISAVDTDYNHNVLDIKLFAVLISLALIVIGVYPRIHKQKLGLDKALAWFRGEEIPREDVARNLLPRRGE